MAEDTAKRFQRIMDKLYHSPKPKAPTPSGGGGSRGTTTQQKGWRRELGSREEGESSMRHVAATIGARDGGPPPCRPWDRGDLMRRLATFKAMTWFGKPKAIDPVNCARRGWVNVEMDTLACEACGARLLFSTPSSWTLQQVEKAAAVFSLKLDSGHKLLCPWIDNICDEALAFFPPTPAPALIEGYKERSAALLQLSALPVISSSAIDYMRSPQLEDLLAESSSFTCSLDGGMNLTASSRNSGLDCGSVADTSSQYYQAHKIISLCGWEPRLLPYVVDREDHSSHSIEKDKAVDSSSEILHNKNHGFVVYPSTVFRESDEERRDQLSLGDQYDPASVVLDCKLCGACVGLWAFTTIVRPLELFNLTESLEEDRQNGPATGSDNSASNEKQLSLNLTIAGGPPPTKQNFKPRISLPIITRHLRSLFGSNGGTRYHVSSDAQGVDRLNTQSSGMLKRKRSENDYLAAGGSSCDIHPHLNGNGNVGGDTLRNEQKTGDLPSTHGTEKGLMHEDRCEQINAKTNECLPNSPEHLVQSTTVTEDAQNGRSTTSELGDGVNLQTGDATSVTIDNIVSKEDEVCENSSLIDIPAICSLDTNGSSGKDPLSHSIEVSHNSQNMAFTNGSSGKDASSHSIEVDHNPQSMASDAIPKSYTISDAEMNENLNGKDDTHKGGGAEIYTMQPNMDGSVDTQEVPVQNNTTLNSVEAYTNGSSGKDASSHSIEVNHNPQSMASDAIPKSYTISDAEMDENLNGKDDTHKGGGAEVYTMQPHMDGSVDTQEVPVQNNTTLNSVEAEVVTVCASRNHSLLASQWDNTDKFDPIRRHRPFCPWIAPVDDKNMPGWKLALRALVQDKCSSQVEAPSPFSDEVDDPIISVRKLFTSPLSKRFKGAG